MPRAQRESGKFSFHQQGASYVASQNQQEDTSYDVPEQNQQEEQKDDSYAASQCFASRSLFDWFADSGATQHMTDQ